MSKIARPRTEGGGEIKVSKIARPRTEGGRDQGE